MNENLTELVFILDRSGSMSGLESDTVGGFNSLLQKQKNEPGEALVSTVLFNDRSVVLHDRVPVGDVKPMEAGDYVPCGSTALVDTVADAIRHVRNVHKYIRPEDVPAHTMFVITTDGMENASRRTSAKELKKMIGERKELGWEFLFLGANIDAVETAGAYGIDASRAVDYNCDGVGTQKNFSAIGRAINSVRCCAKLDEEWAEEVKEDFKSRNK